MVVEMYPKCLPFDNMRISKVYLILDERLNLQLQISVNEKQ